jgi:hypothetical protein
MARTLVIEEEHGTFSGHRHPHNGYFAGDFSKSTTAPSSRGMDRRLADGRIEASTARREAES